MFILALFSLSGLDQAFVQAYAWGTMLRDRAPEVGLSEALDTTFSGDHPCEVCQAIAEASHHQNDKAPIEQSPESSSKDFSPLMSLRAITITPPSATAPLPGFRGIADRSIVLELPTPPPRWV